MMVLGRIALAAAFSLLAMSSFGAGVAMGDPPPCIEDPPHN